MSDRQRAIWRNPLTLAGGALAVVSALFDLSFLFFDLLSGGRSPYVGLWTYLVFPGLLVMGVAAAGLGLLLTRRRRRTTLGEGPIHYYPKIDLNRPAHRRVLFGTGLGVASALPVIGVLSYEGYHYTDSNQFCGLVCHQVMEPQYTAFLNSPHARVDCAHCHIGEGASWYVKSKLSGLRQVWAVFRDSYPRPIPPAIQELRPATETCEQCHWPEKFFGDQLVTLRRFRSDESNTREELHMLLKTGGSDPAAGPPSGIHWHTAPGHSIDFVATDHLLQDVPWVRLVDHRTGRQTIYRSDGLSASDPPPNGTRRSMDCMDCHNRPTHIFRGPDAALNNVLQVHPNLQSLPFAKREAVASLVPPPSEKSEGRRAIADGLEAFYREHHPTVWRDRRDDVDLLIRLTQDTYEKNFFPTMNVDWRTYPNNIGHKDFPGCFRCHDGRHLDEKGTAISHACANCHAFLPSLSGEEPRSAPHAGEFTHPTPLEGLHAALRCDRCHTGGVSPSPSCEGCHVAEAEFRLGTTPVLSDFGIEAEPMARVVDCRGCHDLTKPTTLAAIDAACLDCHDDEEERYTGMLAGWERELDERLRALGTPSSEHARRAMDALREAGPLHNPAAARRILSALAGEAAPLPRPSE